MNTVFGRFWWQFSLYMLAVAALAAYPLYQYGNEVVIESGIMDMVLFYFITLIAFWVISRGSVKGDVGILNRFLAGTAIKMFVSLGYVLIVMRNYPGQELEFAFTFFAAYFITTGFEVYYILTNLRPE